MSIRLNKEQSTKILKVVGWVAVSSAIGGLLAMLVDNPEMFGVFTPMVNVFLVTLQQIVKRPADD